MPANEDEKLWKAYGRGVKALPAKKKAPVPVKAAPRHKPEARKAASRSIPKLKAPVPAQRKSFAHNPLDRRMERDLRQGIIMIEARLDLHGMRQDDAHAALERFISAQSKIGRRNLLIITGKGRGGEGILRANLAGWLAALPEAKNVLALRQAAIRHGGDGAFYVVLRRKN